jgi:outer membrane protein TolC
MVTARAGFLPALVALLFARPEMAAAQGEEGDLDLEAVRQVSAELEAALGGEDTLRSVTLGEALRLAADLNPDYVEALGRVANAEWVRRAAISSFIVPSINAQLVGQRYSSEIFNIGTGELSNQIVQGQISAQYDLFRGGQKVFELTRSSAGQEAAAANELQALFAAALATETAYYDVVASKDLVRVRRQQLERAEQQLAVARARVISGAAVRTDSLQLVLERTRAQVNLLIEQTALRVSRLELARRIGSERPVDAVPLDTLPAPALPISEPEAIRMALLEGPDYRLAAATERVAQAELSQQRGRFLPWVTLFGAVNTWDDKIFPNELTRSNFGVALSLPIWNGAQREVSVSVATTARDAARAAASDEERAVRRDVVAAYQTYNTARASADLARQAVLVARENLGVVETRYRGGAPTIIDLLVAQNDLTDAEAALVEARRATRLALAGLEAIIGRRLFRTDGVVGTRTGN